MQPARRGAVVPEVGEEDRVLLAQGCDPLSAGDALLRRGTSSSTGSVPTGMNMKYQAKIAPLSIQC